MRSISIKARVLGVLALCLSLTALGLIGMEESSYRRNVGTVARQSVSAAQTAFENVKAAETAKLGATLTSLMGDRQMQELYARRDREGLLAYASPIYRDLKSKYGITNWHFMDLEPPMNIFLRLHDPTHYNEVFWHLTAVHAMEARDFATGMELGKFGFALRVVGPYRDAAGRIAGYMEVAEDIANFTGGMKGQTGDDYCLVARKSLLDKDKYAVSMERKKVRNNWDDQPDVVVLGATGDIPELAAYSGDVSAVPAGGQFLQKSEVRGQVFVRGVFPLKDVSGQTIGGVFVRHEVTDLYRNLAAARNRALAAIVGLTLVLSLSLTLLLQRLVFSRLDRTIALATRVVGGEFDTRIVPVSDDEVGRLETLLEGFRNVFVNTVKEFEERLDEDRRNAA